MILLTHIIIALTSIVFGVRLLGRPSNILIKAQIGLIAATLISGVILVFQGASVLHLCATGLLFTAFSLSSVLIASRRLKTVKISI